MLLELTVIGNLGKDAEVKEFENNCVINFSVASTRKWKNKNGETQSKTQWIQCAKWGNNTALIKYLKKGTRVYLEGLPDVNCFVNNKGEADGSLTLNVSKLILLGSDSDREKTPLSEPKPKEVESKVEEEEDDLPF